MISIGHRIVCCGAITCVPGLVTAIDTRPDGTLQYYIEQSEGEWRLDAAAGIPYRGFGSRWGWWGAKDVRPQ